MNHLRLLSLPMSSTKQKRQRADDEDVDVPPSKKQKVIKESDITADSFGQYLPHELPFELWRCVIFSCNNVSKVISVVEEKYEAKNLISSDHLDHLQFWLKELNTAQQEIAGTVAASIHSHKTEWSEMDIREYDAKWQKLATLKNKIRHLFTAHESVLPSSTETASKIREFKKKRQAQEIKEKELADKEWKNKDTYSEERKIK